jgi:hypothetical protein
MQIGAGARRRTNRQVEVINDWIFLTSSSYFIAKWHTKSKHASYHPAFQNAIIENPSRVPVP